ncbi:hypothetical protein FOL47_002726 [Perkinsus chesapeaki]|uniref:Uncharacterized protein n=1 Tax=Perkinsus chesapeaki TaxID=330153 RepID=A0A7J6MCG6_PERCH|nr:hypothetical protein FOL47_002726 [Perkinsus chesapeaki]
MLPPPSTALADLPASKRILAESGYASLPPETTPGRDPLLYGRPRRPFAHLVQHFKELYGAAESRRHNSHPVSSATNTENTAGPSAMKHGGEVSPPSGCSCGQAESSSRPQRSGRERSPVAVISTDIPWVLSSSLRCQVNAMGSLIVQVEDLEPPLIVYQLPSTAVGYRGSSLEMQPYESEGVDYVKLLFSAVFEVGQFSRVRSRHQVSGLLPIAFGPRHSKPHFKRASGSARALEVSTLCMRHSGSLGLPPHATTEATVYDAGFGPKKSAHDVHLDEPPPRVVKMSSSSCSTVSTLLLSPSPFMNVPLVFAVITAQALLGLASECLEEPHPPAEVDCSQAKLGFYTWPQKLWMDHTNTEFIDFAGHPAVRSFSCGGDFWFNVADWSNPSEIKNSHRLLPFIQNLRAATRPSTNRSGRGVVYLTYGDTSVHNERALLEFIDTLFAWLLSLATDELMAVAPIGISLDVEASHPQMVFNGLLRAYKRTYLNHIPEDAFIIQHVVAGYPSPESTKYVMELADSALYLIYRSYMYDNSTMNLSPANNLLVRFRWFITAQCEDCLTPGYQPRAKISVLVESDCNLYEYCGRLSFCAQNEGGIQNLADTLIIFWSELTLSGLLTQERFDALMNKESPYGVHNWIWSRCLFPPTVSANYSNCHTHFNALAAGCRGRANLAL